MAQRPASLVRRVAAGIVDLVVVTSVWFAALVAFTIALALHDLIADGVVVDHRSA